MAASYHDAWARGGVVDPKRAPLLDSMFGDGEDPMKPLWTFDWPELRCSELVRTASDAAVVALLVIEEVKNKRWVVFECDGPVHFRCFPSLASKSLRAPLVTVVCNETTREEMSPDDVAAWWKWIV